MNDYLMSYYLKLYLTLEREMLILDDKGEEDLAEGIREVLDTLWYKKLTSKEISFLNTSDPL